MLTQLHSTFAFQRPRECDLSEPGMQKSGSFPEGASWVTAPCSGARQMLQLHIPIFKQEKLKQYKERVLDFCGNFQVKPGCSSQY